MSVEPRFFNRELSWLEFNQRVLDEAIDQRIPLLERLKFLAITASNLDEFTMVRVGSLQLLLAEGDMRPDVVGLTTVQRLKAIRDRMQDFLAEQYRCLLNDIEPALTREGMRRLRSSELNDRQMQHVQQFFEQEIFPILTPLAVVSPPRDLDADLPVPPSEGSVNGVSSGSGAARRRPGTASSPPPRRLKH